MLTHFNNSNQSTSSQIFQSAAFNSKIHEAGKGAISLEGTQASQHGWVGKERWGHPAKGQGESAGGYQRMTRESKKKGDSEAPQGSWFFLPI